MRVFYVVEEVDRRHVVATPRAPSKSVTTILRFLTGAPSAFAVALLFTCPAHANPEGGSVVSGKADIVTLGTILSVNQQTASAIINWQRFSIAPWETVNFNQPNASSIMLNRVTGNETSVIEGALNANGRIFLVNSAGILFTRGAQVNAGGLVASTLDISNKNFNSGRYVFSGDSRAPVINQGNIRAERGGYIALLGNHVANEGAITATLGTVALASGDKVTLNFGGDALLAVTLNKGTYNALVENKGIIRADGGRVVMTARAADAVLSAQVNNTGVIQARTMAGLLGGARNGSVKLAAIRGNVSVAGRIDASAPRGGRGGTVETHGRRVTIARNAVVTTRAVSGEHGHWDIRSRGFTVGRNGDLDAGLLSKLLASNNIAIHSELGDGRGGDVNINDVIAWSANTKLTLDAQRNVNITSVIAASGDSAGLGMAFANDYILRGASSSIWLTGAHAHLTINGDSYTLINTLAELAALSDRPRSLATGFYALAQNIDASGTIFGGPVIFTLDGTFAGLGHWISNLTIADLRGRRNNALIGEAGSSAVIRDINLSNPNIFAETFNQSTAAAAGLVNTNFGFVKNAHVYGGIIRGVNFVGGLTAINGGTIVDSSASSFLVGRSSIGGLVAFNALFGFIKRSRASGGIYAAAPNFSTLDEIDEGLDTSSIIGGLVGQNSGTIVNSRANAAITTWNSDQVGGLVGFNFIDFGFPGGEILRSSATGWINSTWDNKNGLANVAIGGLVGSNKGGTIDRSRSDLIITLTNFSGQFVPLTGVGGLVGVNDVGDELREGGAIRRSVSSTSIFNDGWVDAVGGLVGNALGGTIRDSFARGLVTTGVDVFPRGAGGLIGNVFNASLVSVRNSRWDINGTGQSAGAGFGGSRLTGLTGVGAPGRASPFALPTPVDGGAAVNRRIRQSASELGGAVGANNTQNTASSPPRKRLASAGTAATNAASDASFDQNASIQEPPSGPPAPRRTVPSASTRTKPVRSASLGDPAHDAGGAHGGGGHDGGGHSAGGHDRVHDEDSRPIRRAAPQPAPKVVVQKPKPPDYGAAIRSIEIDGKKFDLQEKPANGAGKPTP